MNDNDQRGGKILGAGVHGCTFYPTPTCKNIPTIHTINGLRAVGKITPDDIENEYQIGKEITALPKSAQYFAVPSKRCDPQMPVQDKDAAKCKILQEDEQFSMLIMPLAGTTLEKWSLRDVERLARQYENIFVHLLEGMILYQNAGIVHNDIHTNNILVDASNVARFIDFGLAFKLSNVNHMKDSLFGRKFRPEYIYQPPEVHVWRMLANNIPERVGFYEMNRVNPEYGDLVRMFPRREPMSKTLTKLVHMNKAFQQRDFHLLLGKYGKRFDCWRIGITMWYLWVDLLHHPKTLMTSSLYDRRHVIRRVLDGLTDFDIDTRWDAKRALQELQPNNPML